MTKTLKKIAKYTKRSGKGKGAGQVKSKLAICHQKTTAAVADCGWSFFRLQYMHTIEDLAVRVEESEAKPSKASRAALEVRIKDMAELEKIQGDFEMFMRAFPEPKPQAGVASSEDLVVSSDDSDTSGESETESSDDSDVSNDVPWATGGPPTTMVGHEAPPPASDTDTAPEHDYDHHQRPPSLRPS